MTFKRWLNGFIWGVCFHPEQTVPITIDGLTARTCLDCGTRIPWSLVGPPLKPPHLTQCTGEQYDTMFLLDMKIGRKP